MEIKIIKDKKGKTHYILEEKEKEREEKKEKRFYAVSISTKRWRSDWKGLDPIERSLLIDLWLYADARGQNCYPSLRVLAGNLKISRNTTRKHIKDLESKGFLKITTRKNKKWYYNLAQF